MQRGVIVTGASSGIGEATALRLARADFTVFAGVRSDADAQRVGALHDNVRALRIDVTDAASIAAAAQSVRESNVTLAGLVNNAGIAVAGPLEFLPIDDMRRQFEVNVFGALAVTQAVLPLLRASTGRIVFVGSVSGLLAPPFVGAYGSSKFALEAIADVLRMELLPAGIGVSIVEPGAVKTPIWQKGRESSPAMLAKMPPHALEYYGDALQAIVKQTAREERNGMPADDVAAAIEHALVAPRPRARYLLGTPARLQNLVKYVPERMRDRLVRRAMGLT